MEALLSFLPGVLVGAMTWVTTYLVRTVLTNQKQLVKLDTEIKEREKAAQRGREDLKEVKADVKEMNTALMTFFSNHKN
ncbi:MAG: hypothetical protein GQ574_14670 [Crocinitomix sp.]|nr:hypothetical protein [Crocinitomix sp.]